MATLYDDVIARVSGQTLASLTRQKATVPVTYDAAVLQRACDDVEFSEFVTNAQQTYDATNRQHVTVAVAGVDKGVLRGSLSAQAVHLVSGDTVEVTTNADGASLIQHGGEVDVEVDETLKGKVKGYLARAGTSAKRANAKASNAINRGDEAAFPTAASKAVAATARAGDLENALRWLTAPGVKGFTAKVPARPYLAITDEDIADIAELWAGDLLKERARPLPSEGDA